MQILLKAKVKGKRELAKYKVDVFLQVSRVSFWNILHIQGGPLFPRHKEPTHHQIILIGKALTSFIGLSK